MWQKGINFQGNRAEAAEAKIKALEARLALAEKVVEAARYALSSLWDDDAQWNLPKGNSYRGLVNSLKALDAAPGKPVEGEINGR